MASILKSNTLLWILLTLVLSACDSGGGNNSSTPTITLANCVATDDTDGDGLFDCAELTGWDIIVDRNGDGVTVTEAVTSDPSVADTDGDGLDDFGESNSRTDPNSSDTDGDGLNDNDEIITYKSDPRDVDSDNDARGPNNDQSPNPSLFDGNEYLLSGTSPTLADTDGDNKTDYEEIIGGGSSPLIANIPSMEISFVGDINIDINTNTSVACETSANSSRTTLTSNASSATRTNTSSSKSTIEKNAEISTELEATVGTDNWPPSASLKTTASASVALATTQENSTSLEQVSKNDAQNDYKTVFEDGCITSSNFSDGSVSAALNINNTGTFAFNLRDLNLSLERINGDSSSFSVISSTSILSTPVDLGAGAAASSIPVSFPISLADAQELLQNPSELTPIISLYTMSNQEGFNYAYLNDTTIDRTGLVIIDYGDGTVNRYMIATNVNRTPDGLAAGTRMDQIMDILGFANATSGDTAGTYRTANTVSTVNNVATNITALASLNGYADDQLTKKFWMVSGSGSSFNTTSINFEDIVLNKGESIYISLLTDSDADGLYNREEAIYGTRIDLVDSDGDGISDYDEIRTGWTNAFNSTKVFSLATNADSDGDGADDFTEMNTGTDPRNADTDGDGYSDNVEINTAGLDPLVYNTQLGSADYTGMDTNYVAKTDDSMWSWGYNNFGELMTGDLNSRTTPAPANNTSWLQIAAGTNFIAALDTNGALWAAGYGTHDQSVSPDPSIFALPQPNGQTLSYTYVSAGSSVVMAIASDGSLWKWTMDAFSPLALPTQVGIDTNWASVSVGNDHYLALKQDASLWAWGGNFDGQLGLSHNTAQSAPVRVGADNNWQQVIAANGYSVAIRDNNTLWAWGINNSYQLGLNDVTNRNTPNHVCINTPCGLNDEAVWGAIAASENSSYTLALQLDNTLWNWGQGITTTPSQKGTDTDWALISSSDHSIALKTNGSLWSWSSTATPVQVGISTDWDIQPH
ncbi:MAG: hypothetical protein OEY36_06710 [Gammaproteobacteria bacterium]|nr:hypothetical protein [Gammaproteobacteria bacterium]